ncbi:hypothetical protein [Tenacibaculum agarivorans]|uniref:hypothetical protein n=1 Tax=Tenacibaculum agarivorans TaxID=1908389 RepID=UPI00094B7F95|nr:hypothetical protein [Tenacibaculum agarivorans]
MISKEVWNNTIVPETGDVEFDWFGIDQNGYLGAFSTFNRGYIPEIIKSSRIEYLELLTEIENLPFKYRAQLITKEKGRYDDWLEYSQQGFIGFDYRDVHRTTKTGIFDLISKPEKLITVSELDIKPNLIEKMPKFNLSFNQNNGIDEQELRNKIA